MFRDDKGPAAAADDDYDDLDDDAVADGYDDDDIYIKMYFSPIYKHS